MFIRDIRLLNIRVLNQNEQILYEGMVENAPQEITDLNYIGKCFFDAGILVLHI